MYEHFQYNNTKIFNFLNILFDSLRETKRTVVAQLCLSAIFLGVSVNDKDCY